MTDSTEPENRLFDWYRTYIGEPDARTDVYLGFGLFFGGIALGVLALVLFLWGSLAEPRTDPYFARIGPAYTLGMLSLPMAMIGIVTLLPVEKKAHYAAAAGGVVNLAAVVWFNVAYPADWNGYGADQTMQVVSVYATGLTVVVAPGSIDDGGPVELPGVRERKAISGGVSNGMPAAHYDDECDQIKHFDALATLVEQHERSIHG